MNSKNLVTRAIDCAAVGGATGYLRIDLAALGRNYLKLAGMLNPGHTAAVVKADAYGLGADRVARTLYDKGCRHFFVAQFFEAEKLRQALRADAKIFVLNGLQPGNEIACATAGIIPVLNAMQQFEAWTEAARALNRTLPAVLQFDTGMSRLGFPLQERSALAKALGGNAQLQVLFVMSHLAAADDPDDVLNPEQLTELRRIADEFAGFDLSFANSAGVFLGEAYHGMLARPGIALYGGSPAAGMPSPMEPVVSLDVAVVQTRTVPEGTNVGYGGAHVTRDETRLATIAAGYADGLPRSLSGRGAVYYQGKRLPIVGRVSMDSITVDVSALPEGVLALGRLVEVIGPHQTLEDLARDAGTISYEILTRLGQRYHRQYCSST